MPCPIRDHHSDMLNILRENNVKSLDPYAEEALKSDLYHAQLIEYDKKLADVFEPVWKEDFVNHKKRHLKGSHLK